MPTTEELLRTPNQQNLHELRNESVELDSESVFSPDDPLSIQLKELGIRGQPIAEISAGQQVFTVINLSGTRDAKERDYKPFDRNANLSPKSPTRYELDDTAPLVLVHFNGDGTLVGRAIRPNRPIYIGRSAAELDPKSMRFDYQGDTYLSRDHFSLTLSDKTKQITITDRHSTNGTKVRYGIEQLNESAPNVFIPRQKNLDMLVQERSKNDELEITESLIDTPELHPEQKIEIDGQDFYLSPVMKSDRDKAILFSTTNLGGISRFVPRLLYKSRSDGGWRVAYGIEPSGRYIKEAHGSRLSHYVQETKLHPKILDALANSSTRSNAELDKKISNIFSKNNPEFDLVFTAAQEVTYPNDPDLDEAMKPFRALMPGWLDDTSKLNGKKDVSLSDYFRSLDGQFNKINGLVPDFTTPPSSTMHREHTLLGDVVIESFPAVVGGKAIIWEMASDNNGRVWIDNIRYADAKVTSYGNYNIIFNAGLITNKPIEYSSQVENLVDGTDKTRFDHEYDDITPLIGKLLPVRQYKFAKQSR